MVNTEKARHIVFIVHYFPPINSSGAKRVEALSKYLARSGRKVTVITTRKGPADGEFTEAFPVGVEVLQLDWLGRVGESLVSQQKFEPMFAGEPSRRRRVKERIMEWFGQLPDPRLPFAFSLLSPVLDTKVRRSMKSADIVVGSCPPWPMLLAACFVRWRFGVPCVMDYRDQFSECHAMPGSTFAKAVERILDKSIASHANGLVTISDPMAKYYSSFNSNVTTIMNGYDSEAMANARAEVASELSSSEGAMVVRYLGTVSPWSVPRNLLAALSKLQQAQLISDSSLKFEFYGTCAVMEAVLRDSYVTLLPFFSFHAAVPYRKALQLMASADYLLFSETSGKSSLSEQGMLTTKVFEYLGSGRPVIADISRGTLVGDILQKCGTNHFVSDKDEIFETYLLSEQFWRRMPPIDTPFVKTLSREYQAKEYQKLLDAICLKQTEERSKNT